MDDFDQQTITRAVIQRFAATPDERLRSIVSCLIRHLHGLALELRLTEREWESAVSFLTRVGQMCSDDRQEFILLSDALGLSTLVDRINNSGFPKATDSTVLGPFFRPDSRDLNSGEHASLEMTGDPLFVEGRVLTVQDIPIRDATVDIWHADGGGLYDVQMPLDQPQGRARLRTDAQGGFCFWSVQPASYPIPHDGPVGEMLRATGRHPFRPAHVHFMIKANSYIPLVTQLFVAGDPYLESDAVFGVRRSLIADFSREDPGRAPDGRVMDIPWRRLTHDFRLQQAALSDGSQASMLTIS